jgi:hypothetical protein
LRTEKGYFRAVLFVFSGRYTQTEPENICAAEVAQRDSGAIYGLSGLHSPSFQHPIRGKKVLPEILRKSIRFYMGVLEDPSSRFMNGIEGIIFLSLFVDIPIQKTLRISVLYLKGVALGFRGG